MDELRGKDGIFLDRSGCVLIVRSDDLYTYIDNKTTGKSLRLFRQIPDKEYEKKDIPSVKTYRYSKKSIMKIRTIEQLINAHDDQIMLTYTFSYKPLSLLDVGINCSLEEFALLRNQHLQEHNTSVHRHFRKSILKYLKSNFGIGLWVTEKHKSGAFHFHVKVAQSKCFINNKTTDFDKLKELSLSQTGSLSGIDLSISDKRGFYLGYLDKDDHQKEISHNRLLWYYWGTKSYDKFLQLNNKSAFYFLKNRKRAKDFFKQQSNFD